MSEEITTTQDAPTENTESSTVKTEVPESTTANETVQETVPKKDFNKVYWKQKEAEREIERLKGELSSKTTQNVEPVTTVQKSNTPTLEQFDYDQDAYMAAMVDHQVNQRVSKAFEEREKAKTQKQQQIEADEIAKKFNDNYAQYAAENKDYEELRQISGGKTYSQSVNQAILYSENGPQIDHYLLKNPEIAESLMSMPPVTAAINIGKISAELKQATPQIQTSSAPNPIETVGGGNVKNSDGRYDQSTSMADYYRLAMERKKGGA